MLNRKALVMAIGLWSMVLWSATAIAQATVVEQSSRRGQPAAAQAQTENNDLVLSLYNQLESLQQEMQTLRGLVEEQANQIRRMQTENRDRYLDVDRRLSELSGAGGTVGAALPPAAGGFPGAITGAVTVPPTGGATAPPSQFPPTDPQGQTAAPGMALGNTQPISEVPPGTRPAQMPGGASVAVGQTTAGALPPTGVAPTQPGLAGQSIGAELGEQDLYRTALNILLDLQPARYEESISMFRSYIQRFPQGRLIPNAYYWLGEALILVERYEEARDTFTTVITSYPEDPKAASALLKRGEVYRRLGQRDLAEQDWRAISTRYPNSATEIREADTRLRSL